MKAGALVGAALVGAVAARQPLPLGGSGLQKHADFVGMTFGGAAPDTATFDLVMLSNGNTTGAVCLDGTNVGFYWQAGTGLGAYNWMFYFQGGGWVRGRSSAAAPLTHAHHHITASPPHHHHPRTHAVLRRG